MLFYFTGTERFLMEKEIQKKKDALENPEVSCAEFREGREEEVVEFLTTFSFSPERKLCILRFFPTRTETVDTLVKESEDTDIIICTEELPDRRKKEVKFLLEKVEEKRFDKVSEESLLKSIRARLKNRGFRDEEIKKQETLLLEAFSGYFQDATLDLNDVQKHLQLIAMSGELSEENIRYFAPQSAKLKGYKLATMILEKDKDAVAFASSLLDQGENAIPVLASVLYQFRVCYKAVLFQKELYLNLIGIRNYQLFRDFKKYSLKQYKEMYRIANEAINDIKKGQDAKAALIIAVSTILDSI